MKYMYILVAYEKPRKLQALLTLAREAKKTLTTNYSWMGISPNQSWSLHQESSKA